MKRSVFASDQGAGVVGRYAYGRNRRHRRRKAGGRLIAVNAPHLQCTTMIRGGEEHQMAVRRHRGRCYAGNRVNPRPQPPGRGLVDPRFERRVAVREDFKAHES